jgi:hypothetical protein
VDHFPNLRIEQLARLNELYPNDHEPDISAWWETWSKSPCSRLLFDTGWCDKHGKNRWRLQGEVQIFGNISIALHQ